jgi:hypothetical protein
VTGDLVTRLLPGLSRSTHAGFNVFDVMRHGTHEKQLSNFFGWLLHPDGSHGLGSLGQRVFIEQVNVERVSGEPVAQGPYIVRQEVSTSDAEDAADIADLVLDNEAQRIVVENYFTSDGHGHDYARYLRYAQRGGRRGAVVLLCQDADGSRQSNGWEKAAVVTYGQVVTEILAIVPGDYPQRHPEAHSFIDQMYRKFVRRRGRVEDQDVLSFVTTMCATGEAKRYGEQPVEAAAQRFSDEMAFVAVERFGEGRLLLQRIKNALKTYCSDVLRQQLDDTMGTGFVTGVSARYSGIYQWSINFDVADGSDDTPEAKLQVKFGPSAWHAVQADPWWRPQSEPTSVDFSHLFVTRAAQREIRQSSVTMQDVMDGLRPADRRLHDEIVAMWRGPSDSG